VHFLDAALATLQQDLVGLSQGFFRQLLQGSDRYKVGRQALLHHVEVDGVEGFAFGHLPELY